MNDEPDSQKPDGLSLTYGAWLLRLWLGVRALQTGLEKFAGTALSDKAVEIDGAPNDYGLTADAATKAYAPGNYHGVPEALMDKFKGEPLMAGWALNLYDKVLGPALLLLGLMVLVGVLPRTSLFLLGLLYISLTWGLILIGQDAGVAWLAAHMILIVMALRLAPYNRFCVLKKW